MKRKIIKWCLIAVAAFIVLSFLALWYSNNLIMKSAEGKTFDKVEGLPHVKAGLLLGTSKYIANGNVNQYFAYRIKAAVELFKAGKIDVIIISGDNSVKGYDEPTDMRAELINNGVDSTKIYLDYAGFRTFDSMVRLKEIFGQEEVIIISQKFHNERALYIAEKFRIRAYGYNAKDVSKYYGFRTALRERFARVKVILDFMFGVEPRFLGEKVEVE